jgi:preprotein translocase subunit SecY
MSIFALNIMPYISASIIFQLLSAVVPSLEALKKEGEAGKQRINSYTRLLTIFLSFIQAYGIAVGLEKLSGASGEVVLEPGLFFKVTAIFTLVAGTMFVVWLGDLISASGIGNGSSLIIYTGIVAGLPNALAKTFELGKTGAISEMFILLVVAIITALLIAVVFFERSVRKVNIQYPRKQIGNKIYAGDSTHLPIKINVSGVIPPIFASSILLFPLTIANFIQLDSDSIMSVVVANFGHGKPLYTILYVAMIFCFAFFYTGVIFNAEDTAENLKKYGGFIVGRRPGAQTAEYLTYILNRITVLGAMYMAVICAVPEIIMAKYPVPFYLGGTSILIVVNVVTDTINQIQTHLYSVQYDKLLKRARLK